MDKNVNIRCIANGVQQYILASGLYNRNGIPYTALESERKHHVFGWWRQDFRVEEEVDDENFVSTNHNSQLRLLYLMISAAENIRQTSQLIRGQFEELEEALGCNGIGPSVQLCVRRGCVIMCTNELFYMVEVMALPATIGLARWLAPCILQHQRGRVAIVPLSGSYTNHIHQRPQSCTKGIRVVPIRACVFICQEEHRHFDKRR